MLAIAPPLAALAGAALFLGHVFNEVVLDSRVAQLQASTEHTAWTWAASMATFAAGLCCGLLGFLTGRRAPVALACLLAFLALDDFVEVHERLGDVTSDALDLPDWIGPRLWTLLYLPLLGLTVLLGWLVVRLMEPPPARAVVAGTLLLAFGFVLEAVGAATKRLEEAGVESPHMVRAGLEEAVELAGWILVAAGLAAAAVSAVSPSPRAEEPRRPAPAAPP